MSFACLEHLYIMILVILSCAFYFKSHGNVKSFCLQYGENACAVKLWSVNKILLTILP